MAGAGRGQQNKRPLAGVWAFSLFLFGKFSNFDHIGRKQFIQIPYSFCLRIPKLFTSQRYAKLSNCGKLDHKYTCRWPGLAGVWQNKWKSSGNAPASSPGHWQGRGHPPISVSQDEIFEDERSKVRNGPNKN